MSEKTLREQYEDYCVIAECGMRDLLTAIDNQSQLYELSGDRSPIYDIEYRTKEFSHVIEKCFRKKLVESEDEITIKTIIDGIKDIVGIRIVTLYLDDIYRALEMVKSLPNVVIEEDDEQDWVKQPKQRNHYRSLHTHAKVVVPVNGKSRIINIEIQIRTIIDHALWVIEGDFHYKKPFDDEEIDAMYRELSDSLYKTQNRIISYRDGKKPAKKAQKT